MILAGGSLGLIFDMYRILRLWLKPGQISTGLMDLLFWCVAAPILLLYILIANWGELRFYILIGISIGLMCYYLLFSRIILTTFMWLGNVVGRTLSMICQLAIILISIPIRLYQDLALFIKTRSTKRPQKWHGSRLRWKSWRIVFFRRR